MTFQLSMLFRRLSLLVVMFSGCSGKDVPPPDSNTDETEDPEPTTWISLTPDESDPRFGEAVLVADVLSSNPGDEVVVSSPGLNRLVVFDPSTGVPLSSASIDSVEGLGSLMLAVGDVNGDTQTDLLVRHLSGWMVVHGGGEALSPQGSFELGAPVEGMSPVAMVLLAEKNGETPAVVAVLHAPSDSAGPSPGYLQYLLVAEDWVDSAGGVPMDLPGTARPTLASGDWNHDGLPDLAMGSYQADDNAGVLTIALGEGSTGALTHSGVLLLVGTNDGDMLGYALASGDLTADGIDDLIVSAPRHDQDRGMVVQLEGAADLSWSSDLGGHTELFSTDRPEDTYLGLGLEIINLPTGEMSSKNSGGPSAKTTLSPKLAGVGKKKSCIEVRTSQGVLETICLSDGIAQGIPDFETSPPFIVRLSGGTGVAAFVVKNTVFSMEFTL